MSTYSLIATCSAGVEAIVAKELQSMGYETKTENGRVRFQGNEKDIARVNLHLRAADRIKIVMGEFEALTFDSLFEQTKALPWENLIGMTSAFPVSGKSVRSRLHALPTVQKMVKKAIVDRLNEKFHHNGFLPETGPSYPVEISLHKDHALLLIDTTGESLFKRGYRLHKGPAPLKETLAASLVMLSTYHSDRFLYDPTTGSGTIAIEAAMIGRNMAPGLNRHFLAESWPQFSTQPIFKEAREEAKSQLNHEPLHILAADIDHRMIEIAKDNARQAGVLEDIEFKQMQVSDFTTKENFGLIISNPPYGERLNDQAYVHRLYQQMGEIYRPLETWSKYILTSDEQFERYYGQKATKKRKLYNGSLKVEYFQFWGKRQVK